MGQIKSDSGILELYWTNIWWKHYIENWDAIKQCSKLNIYSLKIFIFKKAENQISRKPIRILNTEY